MTDHKKLCSNSEIIIFKLKKNLYVNCYSSKEEYLHSFVSTWYLASPMSTALRDSAAVAEK
jgi:hypothetical protein